MPALPSVPGISTPNTTQSRRPTTWTEASHWSPDYIVNRDWLMLTWDTIASTSMVLTFSPFHLNVSPARSLKYIQPNSSFIRMSPDLRHAFVYSRIQTLDCLFLTWNRGPPPWTRSSWPSCWCCCCRSSRGSPSQGDPCQCDQSAPQPRLGHTPQLDHQLLWLALLEKICLLWSQTISWSPYLWPHLFWQCTGEEWKETKLQQNIG